MNRMR